MKKILAVNTEYLTEDDMNYLMMVMVEDAMFFRSIHFVNLDCEEESMCADIALNLNANYSHPRYDESLFRVERINWSDNGSNINVDLDSDIDVVAG